MRGLVSFAGIHHHHCEYGVSLSFGYLALAAAYIVLSIHCAPSGGTEPGEYGLSLSVGYLALVAAHFVLSFHCAPDGGTVYGNGYMFFLRLCRWCCWQHRGR